MLKFDLGLVHPVKRSEQLKEVLKRDYVDDEVGTFAVCLRRYRFQF